MKLPVSLPMARFNFMVELADYLTRYQFDREPVHVLSDALLCAGRLREAQDLDSAFRSLAYGNKNATTQGQTCILDT